MAGTETRMGGGKCCPQGYAKGILCEAHNGWESQEEEET